MQAYIQMALTVLLSLLGSTMLKLSHGFTVITLRLSLSSVIVWPFTFLPERCAPSLVGRLCHLVRV